MSNGRKFVGSRPRRYSSNMRFHADAWMAAVEVSTPSRSKRTASNRSRVTSCAGAWRAGTAVSEPVDVMRGIVDAGRVFGNGRLREPRCGNDFLSHDEEPR